MRRELVRDAQEKRRQKLGGKSWRDIANELEAENEALKEERHTADVVLRTMAQDMVRKADEVLRLTARQNQLQIELRKVKEGEEADVHAEVEPEGESAQA